MLVRAEMEVDYKKLLEDYNYGLVAYSPLAGGFLTGKYNNGIPEDQIVRANDASGWFPLEITKQLFYNQHATDKTVNMLKELTVIAEKHGHKLTHLAIAWAIKYKHLDSALVGARNAAQLEDTLKALEMYEKLTPELEAEINKVLTTNPTPRMNFLIWAPHAPVRPIAK